MSEAELAKLGGRYTDVHEKGVRGTSGSGLGLSLAFALAELMGGFLRLNSAPGEGVVAHLTLPVVTAAARGKPSGKKHPTLRSRSMATTFKANSIASPPSGVSAPTTPRARLENLVTDLTSIGSGKGSVLRF